MVTWFWLLGEERKALISFYSKDNSCWYWKPSMSSDLKPFIFEPRKARTVYKMSSLYFLMLTKISKNRDPSWIMEVPTSRWEFQTPASLKSNPNFPPWIAGPKTYSAAGLSFSSKPHTQLLNSWKNNCCYHLSLSHCHLSQPSFNSTTSPIQSKHTPLCSHELEVSRNHNVPKTEKLYMVDQASETSLDFLPLTVKRKVLGGQTFILEYFDILQTFSGS